jgi:hypothetical protein
MKKRVGRELPQAREKGLVIRELPDEMLVLDTDRHKAHCLNDFASHVWKRCDGQTTVNQMTLLLAREFQKDITEDAVRLALDRLGKAKLLMEPLPLPSELSRLSRREAVSKFGLAASVAMITSIVVPTEAMAATCGLRTSCKHVCSRAPQVGRGCNSACTLICRAGTVNCGTWKSGQPEEGQCVAP